MVDSVESMMMHGLANPKYTKRCPFEQVIVSLLQELHDVHKSTPPEQFRVSVFNLKENVHTRHIKNGYKVKVRISALSFVVVTFYMKTFYRIDTNYFLLLVSESVKCISVLVWERRKMGSGIWCGA